MTTLNLTPLILVAAPNIVAIGVLLVVRRRERRREASRPGPLERRPDGSNLAPWGAAPPSRPRRKHDD